MDDCFFNLLYNGWKDKERGIDIMNLINVENITKAYTERKLFEHASFSLQEGEKVGVIGINGTGKTTLLRMLAGQEEPDITFYTEEAATDGLDKLVHSSAG